MYSWHCGYIPCIVIYSIEQMESGVRLDFRKSMVAWTFRFYTAQNYTEYIGSLRHRRQPHVTMSQQPTAGKILSMK